MTKIKRNSKINGISPEDRILIKQIIDCCRVLIRNIVSKNPSNDAKASRHKEKKSLAITAVSQIAIEGGALRANDIRQKLPENIKNIHPSVLSRIINHNKRIGRLKSANFKEVKKRGHPTKDARDKVSGPKLYYGSSEFENRINLLLSSPNVLQDIYKILKQENLIFELEKYNQLRIFYTIRNNDSETAWELLKSVYFISRKESKFDEEYKVINEYKESDILLKADQKANSIVANKTAEDYLYVIKQGAYLSSNESIR